jgi:hypothetical protein
MKMMLRAIMMATTILCMISGVQADEKITGNNCPKPSLNIDFEDPAQMQILEHDFIAYEECIKSYAIAMYERMAAINEVLENEVPKQSWTDENEDEQIKIIEEALETLEADGETLVRSRQDLEGLVRAILKNVPAKVFNQWDAETKIAADHQ